MQFDPLDQTQSDFLLELAHHVIAARDENARSAGATEGLDRIQSCFVTLMLNDALRGCIGSIDAHRALVDDVAANAYAAAFRDPRFPPVRDDEYAQLRVSIAVLSVPTLFSCERWQALHTRLVPGRDGLVLSARGCRATYLPSVWAQLPTATEFVASLIEKAGLPTDLPISEFTFRTYTVQTLESRGVTQ